MSEWHEADENDIDIFDGEVNIFVKAEHHGGVYVSLSFDQIKRLAALIESPPTEEKV